LPISRARSVSPESRSRREKLPSPRRACSEKGSAASMALKASTEDASGRGVRESAKRIRSRMPDASPRHFRRSIRALCVAGVEAELRACTIVSDAGGRACIRSIARAIVPGCSRNMAARVMKRFDCSEVSFCLRARTSGSRAEPLVDELTSLAAVLVLAAASSF
jgi:hypothetical protein